MLTSLFLTWIVRVYLSFLSWGGYAIVRFLRVVQDGIGLLPLMTGPFGVFFGNVRGFLVFL